MRRERLGDQRDVSARRGSALGDRVAEEREPGADRAGGARLLHVLKGSVIRKMVIALLLFAGIRALLKGLGLWV